MRTARRGRFWLRPGLRLGPGLRLRPGLRGLVWLAALALATVPSGCTRPSSVPVPDDPGAVAAPAAPADSGAAVVDRVIDGDTLLLRMASGARERVRVIGLDSPETVKPDTPVACFGPQASALAHRLLPVGAQVRVHPEPGGDRDAYGRLLQDVWLPDGRLMAAVMIAAGAARAYPIRPQVLYAAPLAALQQSARAQAAGLWGPPCRGQSFGRAVTRSRSP